MPIVPHAFYVWFNMKRYVHSECSKKIQLQIDQTKSKVIYFYFVPFRSRKDILIVNLPSVSGIQWKNEINYWNVNTIWLGVINNYAEIHFVRWKKWLNADCSLSSSWKVSSIEDTYVFSCSWTLFSNNYILFVFFFTQCHCFENSLQIWKMSPAQVMQVSVVVQRKPM